MPSNDEIQAKVAIAELYADFLEYEKWIDFFAGEYLNKEGNSIYDCCDARRHLMEIRDELSERVSELCSQIQRRNVET